MMEFASEFDAALAHSGAPALFTVDHKNTLRLAPDRTREAWMRLDTPPVPGLCHCLFRDRTTGWVQYIYVTSPDLCREHPRADIAHYPDQDAALAALAALGPVPLCKGAFPC